MADRKTLGKAAKNAITHHILDLITVTDANLETVILACEQEKLISSTIKGTLLDGLTGRSSRDRAQKLVGHIQSNVEIVPSSLDTFLFVLVDTAEGSPATKQVATDVAASYGYELPKYSGSISGGPKPPSSTQMTADSGSALNSHATKKALVQCADLIVESAIDPNALARKLHAKGVISEIENKRVKDNRTRDSEEERRETILDCVKDRIKLNADIFTTFLEVLKDLGRSDLADEIMAKYKTLI